MLEPRRITEETDDDRAGRAGFNATKPAART